MAEPHGLVPYLIHLIAGSIILISAIVALAARKGGAAHILSGRIFVAFGVLAGITALVFMGDIGFVPNIYGTSVLAMTVLISSFLALKKPEPKVKAAELVCFLLTLSVAIVLLKRHVEFVVSDGIFSEASLFTFACASFSVYFVFYDLYFLALKREQRSRSRVKRHMCGMAFAVATMVHAPVVSVFVDSDINFYVKFFGPYLIWPLVYYAFSLRNSKGAKHKYGFKRPALTSLR